VDAGSRDCDREVALSSAGAADQDSVALLGEKAAACQVTDQGLVDRRAGEVELINVLG
jgi:hypothetical protein